jgi:hypothetical protein
MKRSEMRERPRGTAPGFRLRSIQATRCTKTQLWRVRRESLKDKSPIILCDCKRRKHCRSCALHRSSHSAASAVLKNRPQELCKVPANLLPEIAKRLHREGKAPTSRPDVQNDFMGVRRRGCSERRRERMSLAAIEKTQGAGHEVSASLRDPTSHHRVTGSRDRPPLVLDAQSNIFDRSRGETEQAHLTKPSVSEAFSSRQRQFTPSPRLMG